MSRRTGSPGVPAEGALQVRLLGGLELDRAGEPLGLDLSRKTRALLGYLVASARSEGRSELCDLFWQGPDDPRGSLRWSLSRIRKALGVEAARLQVNGDRVCFVGSGATIDWEVARGLVGDSVAGASSGDLRRAAELLRGELLAGLDLDDCFRYQAWCLAERERVRTLRLAVLRALVERLAHEPEQALPYARAWVAADPLAEPGHAELIRLLAALGRHREALEQYQLCRRILETELGVSPSVEIERARMRLRPAPRAGSAPPNLSEPSPAQFPGPPLPVSDPRLVGRRTEQEAIAQLLTTAGQGGQSPILFMTGEPGIGKSRLLAVLAEQVRAAGGRVFHGRAFEAEVGRAFGLWSEALGADVEMEPPFAGVLEALRPAGAGGVTALLLDDLQWADEASIELLHFTTRSLGAAPGFIVALAARPGDLADNRPAGRLVRGLRRHGRLQELVLGPLAEADVRALTAASFPDVDLGRVVEHSEGNPLFALEVARALQRGDDELSGTLEHIISGHLERPGPLSRAVLPWVAALGRRFEADLLPRLCPWPAADLCMALEELERHGVLRALPEGGYDFAHDLYRLSAYRQLSGPRRQLVHAQIAGALAALDDPAGARAAELARHASLGGAPWLAARACLAAGIRCQRLLAPGEAAAFAERGLQHLEHLAGASAIGLVIGLLRLKVLVGGARASAPAADAEAALARAIAAAEASGLLAEAASGYYALSVLHQERGELDSARVATLRADTAGRAADAATSARQRANTARCLLQLERDIGRARQLAREARELVDRFQLDEVELCWAEGLLQRWDGRASEAEASLVRAAALASTQEDRQREHGAQLALLMLDLESGRPVAALARSRALAPVSRKLGPAELAQVEALAALAAAAAGEPEALPRVERAIAGLRGLDSKAHLSYVLGIAGDLALGQGATGLAGRLAAEAQATAQLMELGNEAALAAAVMARVALTEGNPEGARRCLDPWLAEPTGRETCSAYCRQVIQSAVGALDPRPKSMDRRGELG